MESIIDRPRSRFDDDPEVDIRVVGLDHLDVVKRLNHAVFREDRVINTFEREDLLILMAFVRGEPVGFKIGYKEDRYTFYSAKGGVVNEYRGKGIAAMLLQEMCQIARGWGYRCLAYDSLPNKHPGMTVLGLREGFVVTRADYNPTYGDFRLRFERDL